MRKYLTLITLAFTATLAKADFWDNCTAYGGTIVQANKYGADKGGLCNDPNDTNLTNNCNGKRFCGGGFTFSNWWSMFTWCEAIGGHFVSFTTLCPGNQVIDSGTCANVKGIGSGEYKTSTGWGTNNALAVSFSNGGVFLGNGRQDSYKRYRPVCEE